jgi:hypothetical protein
VDLGPIQCHRAHLQHPNLTCQQQHFDEQRLDLLEKPSPECSPSVRSTLPRLFCVIAQSSGTRSRVYSSSVARYAVTASATLMGLGRRQNYRLRRAFSADGPAGLASRKRGRPLSFVSYGGLITPCLRRSLRSVSPASSRHIFRCRARGTQRSAP